MVLKNENKIEVWRIWREGLTVTTERYSANEKWLSSSCNAKSWYRSCLWCWWWCSLLVVKMIQICCLCVGVPCTSKRQATSATQSCKKKPLDACMMVTTLPREETRATSTHYQHQRRQLVHQKQLQREKIPPEMEVALRYKIVFTVCTVCNVHTVYMRC